MSKVDVKERKLAELQRKRKYAQMIQHRKNSIFKKQVRCFWTRPLGHVYNGHRCVGCEKYD